MKTYLAIMSVIMGAFGALSTLPALFSVMMFDAPGATENPATVTLFVAIASCPIVCYSAIFSAWLFYRENKFGLARIVVLAPLLNLLVGGIALYCLEVFYDGRFNG